MFLNYTCKIPRFSMLTVTVLFTKNVRGVSNALSTGSCLPHLILTTILRGWCCLTPCASLSCLTLCSFVFVAFSLLEMILRKVWREVDTDKKHGVGTLYA